MQNLHTAQRQRAEHLDPKPQTPQNKRNAWQVQVYAQVEAQPWVPGRGSDSPCSWMGSHLPVLQSHWQRPPVWLAAFISWGAPTTNLGDQVGTYHHRDKRKLTCGERRRPWTFCLPEENKESQPSHKFPNSQKQEEGSAEKKNWKILSLERGRGCGTGYPRKSGSLGGTSWGLRPQGLHYAEGFL